MNEMSSEARDLLRAARSFDDPSDADAQRIHASVLVKVGAAVGAGAALTAASSSLSASPAALLGGTLIKVGAAILVAGGLATGAYVALRSPSGTVAKSSVVQTPELAPASGALGSELAPSTAKEPDPVVAAAPLSSPAKAARGRPPATTPNDRAGKTPRLASDLEGEARLLEQADADLRRGDPSAALVSLAEHATKYPAGALKEEREGVRVVALCRAGRASEGKAAAERFLARSPRSALATRIRAACGGTKAD